MTTTSSTMHHVSSITCVADIGAVDGTGNVTEEQQHILDTRPAKNMAPTSPFLQQDASLTNFCSASGGARVLYATDEWFAAADNLCKDDDPVFDPLAFCEQGKVMDGWESRRRREVGHDWCLIKLGKRASGLVGVEIDTAHFTGNNVPRISLELADLSCEQEVGLAKQVPGIVERLLHGCQQGTGCPPEEVEQAEEACRSVAWKEIMPCTPLRPGYESSRLLYFTFPQEDLPLQGTHLRINYFPDGGVARLRLWGHYDAESEQPTPVRRPPYVPIKTGLRCAVIAHTTDGDDDDRVVPSRQAYQYPELSSEALGGRSVACSNKHYGTPQNLLQACLGTDMGDGWETARHPERPNSWKRNEASGLVDSDLMDWCILQLGQVAHDGIDRVLLDTKHFRGNYPESVLVEGCYYHSEEISVDNSNADALQDQLQVEWFPLLSRCRMAADAEHVFDRSLNHIQHADRKVSHIRVSIYPDGGLSRVRVYAPGAAAAAAAIDTASSGVEKGDYAP